MNKVITLLVVGLFLLIPANAQTDEVSSVTYDGSAYSFSFVWNKKESIRTHLPGLSFSFNNLNGLDDISNANLNSSQSYSIALGLGGFNARIADHWVFGIGARLDFARYHFKGNVGLREIVDPSGSYFTTFVDDPEGRTYKSSKLILYYVTIPVVLEYQCKVNGSNRFWINGGVEGLVKYYSKSQVDIKETGHVKKQSLGHDLNINPISARLVFNIGFDKYGLTAFYQPISLFKSDRGPDLYPWGIGFAVGF
ncbi:outer membrane beta-barrel protein [Bacteroidales bacterium OttesenSCG-928-M11]|nr:outer membrane beta-barrel protein [Bacteroidales bacterium OttesenSCG-928-M11]